MNQEEPTPEELAAIANEKDKINWFKGVFQEALNEFTSSDQAITYIASQPQAIFDETIEKIDKDIALHASNRDAEDARVTELEARKEALQDARD